MLYDSISYISISRHSNSMGIVDMYVHPTITRGLVQTLLQQCFPCKNPDLPHTFSSKNGITKINEGV